MLGRRFSLTSSWILPRSRQLVWDVLTDPQVSWPRWWPGCAMTSGTTLLADDAGQLRSASLTFKAGLGYQLMVDFSLTEQLAPERLEFSASGDLVGTGEATLSALTADSCELTILWKVRPTKAWMVLLSPLAAPLFAWAHGQLMRRGEDGLRRYLNELD